MMTDEQKRTLLFLLGCIPARSGIAALAKNINRDKLPVMGYAAMVPAVGFMVIYLGGFRKTGAETMGQPIWWNDFRPIHAALYALFAYLALQRNPASWMVLVADVMLALGAFALVR